MRPQDHPIQQAERAASPYRLDQVKGTRRNFFKRMKLMEHPLHMNTLGDLYHSGRSREFGIELAITTLKTKQMKNKTFSNSGDNRIVQ